MLAVGRERWDLWGTILIFLLAVVAERQEWFATVEEQTVSVRQILRTDVVFPADQIRFVVQDEAFFEAYGSWPLRRTDLASIAANLSELGARVVALDNLFDFASSYAEDAPAGASLDTAGNVLTVSQGRVADGRMIGINYPVGPIREAARTGYTNIESTSRLVESMSRLRIYPEAIAFEDGWPFAVQAVAMYLDAEPEWHQNTISFGDRLRVPLPPDGALRIDYPQIPPGSNGYADAYGLSALEFLDLDGLDAAERRELEHWMSDKIVIFGDTSEVSHDIFNTPLGQMYGIEVIAASVATLLAGGPLMPAGPWAELAAAVLVLLGILLVGLLQHPALRFLAAGGILLVWGGLVTWSYVSLGLIFAMSYVGMALVASLLLINLRYYLKERDQRALVHDAFGQYLSPKVVNILVKDPSRLRLGGERREMTAYFSDIAGFSTISEKLSPEELVTLLNEYLTAMCDIIAEYEGTVDKFEGDAIIAFWGAPLGQADHARKACLAAIDMQAYMVDYRQRLEAMGQPGLRVRMGMNTGDMLVGNLGSAQRMDYTMMGDAVNLAARLEGANKFYGTETMISEFTYQHVTDHVEVRELDLVRVVGRSEPVRVYELLGRKGGLSASQAQLQARHEEALAAYRARDFEAARRSFERILSEWPEDGPAQAYVARCEAFLQQPPPASWDGVFQLESKG